MRTCLVLAMICAAGCDQLSTLEGPQARWTSSHDGIALSPGVHETLLPERGSAVEVVHLRVGLSSQRGTTSGDASSASLVLPGQPERYPVAMNATVSTLPVAVVAPDSPQTLDLFFALPAGGIPRWAMFAWSVSTANGPLVLRALVPIDDGNDPPALAGQRWWFASSDAWATYRHQDGIITARPPTSATVRQPAEPSAADPIADPCDEW